MPPLPAHHANRPPTRPLQRACRAALLLLLIITLPACLSVGPRNFENENDALREERQKLEQQLAETQAALARRESQLRALQTKHNSPTTQPGSPRIKSVGPPNPQLTTLRFASLSGPLDTNDDGTDDTLRIYLQTLDDQGRFLPAFGSAKLQAAWLRDDQPPTLLVDTTLDHDAFNAAYRDNFVGTHYTLSADLPNPLPADLDALAVKATLTTPDGRVFTTQKTYPIQHAPTTPPTSP
ncbi:MAG: hypothetical protein AAF750_13440 [Planctomycetota bacterium]